MSLTIHGLAARAVTVIANKLGQGGSQCCHFSWVICICQTHKCWICCWKYLQKGLTVIWQTKKSLCLQKGMKTEQWSIYFILMKPVFLLKEWLQSHISFKAITKCFRNLRVEEMEVHFVTEINAQGWLITHQHNATAGRRDCQVPQNRWKAFQSTRKLACPVHALLRLWPSVLSSDFLFFLVACKILIWLTVAGVLD